MSASSETPVAPERPLAEAILPGVGAPVAVRTNLLIAWLAATALALIVGGVGPWASFAGVLSISGTEGGDGWLLIIAGGASAGLAVRAAMRKFHFKAMVATTIVGALAVLVAVIDLADIGSYGEGTAASGVVNAGWGLYLALLGALSLAVGGAVLAVRTKRAR